MSPVFLLLPVFLPILGGLGFFVLKFQRDSARNAYSEAVTVLTTALVWIAVFAVPHGAPAEVYSFTAGFSVTFQVDGPGALFAGMISLMWPLVLLYAFEYMEHAERKNVFFAFYVMTYGVALGIAFSADMITMYVFYEMLTLVTIPLVAHYADHESLFASRVYAAFTIGGAGLAFFPVIMTTVYGDRGTFVFGGNLASGYPAGLMQAAFVLGFFGFGAKAALFPLYDWLPRASAAPTPVTALLHAVAVVNSGVFAVMRMTWYVYDPAELLGTPVQIFCLMTAVFSLIFGAVMALRERHFKRRLAYSTMSNLSYMLFGLMLMTPAGLTGGLSHMVFHGVIKMLLFLCAGAFMHVTGKSWIFELNGVGKRMPVTFTCYTLGALSLTGIPLLCGFISKWKLLEAGADAGTVWGWLGDLGLIISAFLCAMYTLSVSIRAFFPMRGKDRFAEGEGIKEAGWRMLVPIVVFTAVNVAFGIWWQPLLRFLEGFAQGIF